MAFFPYLLYYSLEKNKEPVLLYCHNIPDCLYHGAEVVDDIQLGAVVIAAPGESPRVITYQGVQASFGY